MSVVAEAVRQLISQDENGSKRTVMDAIFKNALNECFGFLPTTAWQKIDAERNLTQALNWFGELGVGMLFCFAEESYEAFLMQCQRGEMPKPPSLEKALGISAVADARQ